MGFDALIAFTDRAVRDVAGDTVTYTPGSGPAAVVEGLFDAVYQRVELGGAGVESAGPSVWLLLEDLPTDPESDSGATVAVGTVVYRSWKVEKDGMGGVRLFLHLANNG